MGKNNPADLPKFLYATNFMADDSEYVYHAHRPRFIACHTPDSPISSFEIIEEIDNMDEFFNGDTMKIAGLMRRLGDWWVAYKSQK